MSKKTGKYLNISTKQFKEALRQRDAFKEMLVQGYKPVLERFGIWLQEHGFIKGENMQEVVDKFIKTKQFL